MVAHEDTFGIKPVMKSRRRTLFLAIFMISSTNICFFYLRQTDIDDNPKSMQIELRERQTDIRDNPKSMQIERGETQTYIHDNPISMRIERREQHCHRPKLPPAEIPYVHYPKPTTYSRRECACTPVRFFAILSNQRSGSGWLVTLLNSHVNISTGWEIFSVQERRDNISAITEMLDKVYNLDLFGGASRKACIAAVGFKWMLNQGLMEHRKEIVKYFNRRRVSAIFLFRRNVLRQLISIQANEHDRDAKQLNGTHKAHVLSGDEAEALAKYKPTINVTQLIPNLRHLDRSTTDALQSFKRTRHILLYYEDLVRNRTKLMDVQRFLGVPTRRLVSPHRKIHTRPLSEQVQNWQALYKAIKRSRYKSFLNADYHI